MKLLLGTAMWGWTIPKAQCFELLDAYYEAGFRWVDTATNYPINKVESDFRLAESWLTEWLQAHRVKDLQICMKVGSINNKMTPEHLLTPSFLLMNLDDYQVKFGENLALLMIHWDNRSEKSEIQESFQALEEARSRGIQVGLSGIRHPGLYAALNEQPSFDFHIQIKHNVFQSAYGHYEVFHGQPRFIAYGINGGGIKLDGDYRTGSSAQARGVDPGRFQERINQIRHFLKDPSQPLRALHELGLLYAYYSPDIEGILIGPSKLAQLKSTLHFYEQVQNGNLAAVYEVFTKAIKPS